MAPRITVVGLGPASADLVPPATTVAIDAVAPDARFVRTARHPSAEVVSGARTFDDVYEAADVYHEVYATIAERLVDAAGRHGEVLYAVPGSPFVLERSVELLVADPRVEVTCHPAMSFLDLVWARLGVDPVDAGVRLVDGHRFGVEAAGQRGPLLVAHTHDRQVLSDLKLAVDGDPDEPVVVLQRLGLADETVTEVPWSELDRSVEPDHLTCCYLPTLAAPVAAEVVRLDELVRTLRLRCPWDARQTHQSLAPHLLEEAHEVLEAIDSFDGTGDDCAEHLAEELGDLMFQVVLHSVLGAEAGRFDLADVCRGVHDKLVARHPHVFGPQGAADADAVMANWETAKRHEKGRDSVMDGIPAALPALARAAKVQRKAAAIGLVPPDHATVVGGLAVELSELRQPADVDAGRIGDLLFSVVSLARDAGVDAEGALRRRASELVDLVRGTEAQARAEGLDLDDLTPAALHQLSMRARP